MYRYSVGGNNNTHAHFGMHNPKPILPPHHESCGPGVMPRPGGSSKGKKTAAAMEAEDAPQDSFLVGRCTLNQVDP